MRATVSVEVILMAAFLPFSGFATRAEAAEARQPRTRSNPCNADARVD